jgi:hypothetical protein
MELGTTGAIARKARTKLRFEVRDDQRYLVLNEIKRSIQPQLFILVHFELLMLKSFIMPLQCQMQIITPS